MTTTIASVQDLLALAGRDLGASAWRRLGQDDVDRFADLTDDHQWIHVDPERAHEGPFGTTVAHGMLTLSFVPVFVGEVLTVQQARFGLNYGFDSIRFTSPVPSGSHVRGHVTVADATPVEGGVRAAFDVRVELSGHERPALVARNIVVWRE